MDSWVTSRHHWWRRTRFEAFSRRIAGMSRVVVKKDGEAMAGESRELVLYRTPADAMKPYDRLLGDAISGDATLFARKDAVEQSWRVVDSVLGNATPVYVYEPGSWGPDEATRIGPEGGWSNPT
jgi:glucose-6-phosphate 1-dehydrogenase